MQEQQNYITDTYTATESDICHRIVASIKDADHRDVVLVLLKQGCSNPLGARFLIDGTMKGPLPTKDYVPDAEISALVSNLFRVANTDMPNFYPGKVAVVGSQGLAHLISTLAVAPKSVVKSDAADQQQQSPSAPKPLGK